jgi:hypothetical protein
MIFKLEFWPFGVTMWGNQLQVERRFKLCHWNDLGEQKHRESSLKGQNHGVKGRFSPEVAKKEHYERLPLVA